MPAPPSSSRVFASNAGFVGAGGVAGDGAIGMIVLMLGGAVGCEGIGMIVLMPVSPRGGAKIGVGLMIGSIGGAVGCEGIG